MEGTGAGAGAGAGAGTAAGGGAVAGLPATGAGGLGGSSGVMVAQPAMNRPAQRLRASQRSGCRIGLARTGR
ncbi:MAG: hypothetical protein FJ170_04205 [Gammaproteobacteria bacterium]|nr:hypothetical protein [Gammaproteobacteria bacterium]